MDACDASRIVYPENQFIKILSKEVLEMKKFVCLWAACFLIVSFVSTSIAAERTYRGVIKQIAYDLKENKILVDVFDERTGQGIGRGQLFFETEASKPLAEMIHQAFVNNIKVEVKVYITDERGRPNVIHAVTFTKVQ